MEVVQKVKDKVKGKVGDKVLDMLEGILDDIDIIDQLADMVKSSLPLKAEFTVKGNKKLEINVLGIKEGKLWISVQKIHKEKPATPKVDVSISDEVSPAEAVEAETET